ncbi:MAG: hypothetical protein ACHQ1D_02750 [Nitrososphaerales archaeon]
MGKLLFIAHGFPDNILSQMKELAASRKIILLDGQNYKQAINEDLILKSGLEAVSSDRLLLPVFF